MRISWNWLSEFVDLSKLKGPHELAELLTDRGLEVEAVESLGAGLEKVISAQILEKTPHPQADRLSLCQVTIGGGDPLEIVCGAQNMKVGDKVALAQVGAELPNGVKIARSKIRGIVSDGMLCSEEELNLKKSSEGILILKPQTPLGVPVAQILGRSDTLLFLKLTANRGDCLSHFGIAREVGAALGVKPKLPPIHSIPWEHASPISVNLDAGKLVPQFFGIWMDGIQVGPSPDWVVKRLEALGSRSINNVVDATNWVLFELGHPMHAYDGKKISGQQIHVRISQASEELPLLDGGVISLTGSELVIADEQKGIALAGVMGGSNSEVDDQTQTLFLECAEFDPTWVRRAANRFQRKTEAAHRFERGVNPEGLSFAIARLASLIQEWAGGKIFAATWARNSVSSSRKLQFEPYYLHHFLGFEQNSKKLQREKIQEIFQSLDCQVDFQGKFPDGVWEVIPPSYRLDLGSREDLAEEIARSLGYDEIPSTIPPLRSAPSLGASSQEGWHQMNQAKESMVRSGFLETINFAFTSETWLAKLGMSSSVQVLNPLSEEHQSLVPSLLPGLIRNALENWNHHFGSEPLSIRLFEFRPVFSCLSKVGAQSLVETGVQENWKLAFLMAGPRFQDGLRSDLGEVDFYDLKASVDHLFRDLGSKGIRYQSLSSSRVGGFPLFHPGKSVEILAGKEVAGYFGLLHPGKAKELKVRGDLWLGELDWNKVSQLSRKVSEFPLFKEWPEFPAIERDFALVLKNEVTAEKICQIALKAGKPLAKIAKVFDIYRGSQVGEGMTSVAVRVIFYEEGRSLQESEAEASSACILESWKKDLGAELRG